MEIINFQVKEINQAKREELKSLKLNYIFYWQSNPNPFDIKEKQTWSVYDEDNQIHLNLKYEEFLKDKNNYCFPLLNPSNNYNVNFKEFTQVHKIDSYKIRPIKVNTFENYNHIKCKNTGEDLPFFWKENQDPWNNNEISYWAPYDEEDQYILIKGYKIYLSDKNKNRVELKKPADHFVDFLLMLQISKHDPDKQRQVIRSHPKLVTNIVRKNRFYTSNKIFNFKPDFIDQETLNEENLKSFLKSPNQKSKKLNKIYFKVFPEFHCEIEIEEQLSIFKDRHSIDFSLTEIKSILIEEIYHLAKDKSDSFYNSAKKYESEIKQIIDYESFFQKMVFIYSLESYLYKNLNDFLRNRDKSNYEKIKYYYVCLLSSFQYLSTNTKLNKNEDTFVYRASKISEEEFKEYNSQKDMKIIRKFKEFLSTSKIKEKAMFFFNQKNNPNTIEFLWKIRIPKEIIKNEPTYFVDISELSNYDEKEILIRSGAIIQIDKIIPYTEKIGDKIITYKNKFKKICTLKSFSIASFLKIISLDFSIQKLNLDSIKLGLNENNLLYLKELLIKNSSVKQLFLSDNNLGSNVKNMIYLKEALEVNKSIENLYLYDNNLGSNENNMFYLKEALEQNDSIKTLDLSSNSLITSVNNMRYLKEALEKKDSIQTLNLYDNDLGLNEKNIQYLKEGLEKNTSIQILKLSNNCLGYNEKNMLYLKEALENNKSIETLNLSWNELGLNYNNMLYFKGGLEKNNSIQTLHLQSNNLGLNEKNMQYLMEALKINNSIQTLNIEFNNLGSNEKNIFHLKEALEKNNSIKSLILGSNNLGINQKNMLYLNQGLKMNNSIISLDLSSNSLDKNNNNMLFLKEGLEKNQSIQTLDLFNNNLGSNENNLLYMKEALVSNDSIKELILTNNDLGSNENNMLYLKEALELNSSIQTLNLYNNNLGSNEKNMFFLKEALEQNNSIQYLNLESNKLGMNEKNMLYLKEALEKNNSIQTLDLYDNSLELNENNIFYLLEALKINNSIQILNIDSNNLGLSKKI